MSESPNQPRDYDVVLGGQAPPPVNGVVLGGLEGVKKRLASQDVEQIIAALSDALNYDANGLELVIKSLTDESEQLQQAAYRLLLQSNQLEIKEILLQHIPYKFFERLFILEGHTRVSLYSMYLHEFAICSDSQTLLTFSHDETIKLWNLRTGELLNSFVGKKEGLSFGATVTLSQDGRTCFIGYSNNRILVRDLKTGQLLKTLKGRSKYIICLAVSRDGKILVSGSKDEDVEMWDLTTGKPHSFGGKSWYVNFVDISPDGLIAISQSRGAIKVWNLQRKEQLHTLDWGSQVDEGGLCIGGRISPNGETVVGINSNIVQEWNLKTGELLHRITLNSRHPKTFAFSPDWKTTWGTYPLGTIKIWNWRTGELLHTLYGHDGTYIKSIAISPDGQTVVTCGNDGTIQVWGLQ